MSIGDIILALIVVAVVFFAVRSVFVKKSVGCSGDCAHCGGSCHHSHASEKEISTSQKPSRFAGRFFMSAERYAVPCGNGFFFALAGRRVIMK